MLISVEVPDPIAHSLCLDGPQRGRLALEMFAVEGYRSGKLSRGQVSELLNLGFHETEQFLHDHKAFLEIDTEEVKEEAAYLRKLLSR